MSDLDALIISYSDQEEAALYERYPLYARTLENRFMVEADPDGVTFWLRDGLGLMEAEPHGGEKVADEARMTRILHMLMAARARTNARE